MTKKESRTGDISTSPLSLEADSTMNEEHKETATQQEKQEDKPRRKAGAQKGKPHNWTGQYQNKRRRLNATEISKALLYTQQGIQQTDIAKMLNVTDASIKFILDKFAPVISNLKDVPDYKIAKSDLLNAGELTVLKSILKPEALETARLGELAKTFDVFYKAGRLERGLSTQNIESFTRISVDKHNS